MKKAFSIAVAALMALMMLMPLGCGQRTQPPVKQGQMEFAPTPAMATPTPDMTAPDMTTPDMTAAPEVTETPAATPEAAATPSPTPEASPKATPSATTPAPTKTPEQEKETSLSGKPLSGLVIGLDPGHQKKSNKEQEPVAPGSSETKKKVSSGTEGKYTGVAEHEVNLAVGLLLRDLLEDAGAKVVMTRTKADVNISNKERAELFNEKKVDLGIRLHCNGSTNASKKGAFMLVPGDKNYPYYSENVKAAKTILAAYGKATELSTERGITYPTDQTGFNWCTRPIVNIEMGHMTYESDDLKLVDQDFQKKMAKGIYNGVVEYFS